MPAAPRRGSALCSSALGEVCWAASASPGGEETRLPHLGTQEGPERGRERRTGGMSPHRWGWGRGEGCLPAGPSPEGSAVAPAGRVAAAAGSARGCGAGPAAGPPCC